MKNWRVVSQENVECHAKDRKMCHSTCQMNENQY